VSGHAHILLARVKMACGQAPPQRRADHGVQTDVDASGGVDGTCRGAGALFLARGGWARGPAADVRTVVALNSDPRRAL